MLSTFSARRAPRTCPPDDVRVTGPGQVPRAIELIRTLVLVMVLVTVPFATPHVGDGAQGIAIGVALGVCVIAWIAWVRSEERYPAVVVALAVLAAAGGTLAGLSTFSTAVAIGCVVTSAAGSRLDFEVSAALTLETVAAFLITGIAVGAPLGTLVGYPAAFLGLWAFGLTRREYLLRAEQAEQALEQARRAHAAETQAAALAERARIAREIHDVLAHSLAAVSVNLQAAEGLLGELPGDRPELAKAIECVERAGAFTREGLAEARRAILALRDGGDGVSALAPRPLAEQLADLAGQYRADGDTPVEFTVTGDPRPVGAEVRLTVYRTAQEALTNARKHAPGQPVTVALEFSPSQVTVDIRNPLPPAGAARPLAGAGTGYGLVGLKERAALGGGSLIARPTGGEWRVSLTMPA
ncbi:MAG: histidine kinase [Trebonia sp.]|uniref:sensor histidine kinase n=1 Tax=Trebonia sp. TaxID=2767075 RepID=UPI003BC56684